MKVHNFNIKNSDDSVTIVRVALEENVWLLEKERFAQKVFKVKDYKDLKEIIYFVKTIVSTRLKCCSLFNTSMSSVPVFIFFNIERHIS